MRTIDRENNPGSRLIIASRYEIDLDNPIGVGGMAMVYLGHDMRTKRKVAVKTLRPEYQRDPESRKRFRQEARMMAFVSHPNLVTIYDLHDEGSGSWMVMEYVEGQNLRELLEEEGPFDPETVMSILSQAGSALSHMHSRRLVHLDIKPQNLIRTPDGTIKLIDFGLAQTAGSPQDMVGGTAFGTVAYLAPEQASGETVDAATDVYSLGCVVYELLTGRTPFVSDGPDQKRQLIDAHLNMQPQAPSTVRPELRLPSWIDDVLGWALAKKKRDRFHDVETFIKMFDAGLDGDTLRRPVHQTMPFDRLHTTEPERTGVFRRRRSISGPLREDRVPVDQPDTISEIQPVRSGRLNRAYRRGGKFARRSRRYGRTLWRLTAIFAIANVMLALILLAQDGPAALVERFLSIAPGTTTQVVVDGLNMRSAPGADSPVVTVLPDGQEVQVSGLSVEDAQGRWWPVELEQDGQTIEGWVWEGGLQPNMWTGRLSWMQNIVDGVKDTRNRIQGGINTVLDFIPGLMVQPRPL